MPCLSHTGTEVQGVGGQKVKADRKKRVLRDLLDLPAMLFLQKLQRMLRIPLNGKYLGSQDDKMSLALKFTVL